MSRFVAGIDLGSTGVKVLVTDADDPGGPPVVVDQRPTPWHALPGGRTDLRPADLVTVLTDLCGAAARALGHRAGPGARVEAVAVSGMGETGFLLDRDGTPVGTGTAWFDPRGEDQLAALAARFGTEVPARTGLPLGVQLSVVKLAALTADGLDLRGLRWFNLPDAVAVLLGGTPVVDASLTSRTGLLDQDTGAPWPELLDHLGLEPGFLPPVVDAGSPRGTVSAAWAGAAFAGAALTVAGHDHLVSAVAAGAVDGDRYHASLGTAEVLLRVLDEPLPAAARIRLAEHCIDHVRHVVPGRYVLVAGVKTGLLQRRALHLCGIGDRVGRDRLDEAVLALPPEGALPAGSVEVRGARNDDGLLRLVVHGDGVGPAELFAAVLRHGNDELATLLRALDRELPSPRSTVLTGGWTRMRSVVRARSLVLPHPTVSDRDEDTAHGAALFAARLLTPALAGSSETTLSHSSPAALATPGRTTP